MLTKKTSPGSPRRGITAPQGFRAAGIHCGIKKPGLLDLALVVSEQSGPIAGVFTLNQVVAAPVIVDRLHLRKGVGRAILVNSGNANACTGANGLAAAKKTATLVARHVGVPSHQVFIGSTGVIGRVLPLNRIMKGIPNVFSQLSDRGGPDAARAIMTTDTVSKQATRSAELVGSRGSATVRISGACKGAAMIARAASSNAVDVSASAATACGIPASIFDIGKNRPITPVEQTKMSSVEQASVLATHSVIRSASAKPRSPVAAFALPALITTPRPVARGSRDRVTFTGAPQTRFCVNTPAVAAGRSLTNNAKSNRPESPRTPHATPDVLKPKGNSNSAIL